MAVEHIVWDWNGTLFSDSAALIESTIDAFAAAGFPPITREQYQRLHTQPIPLAELVAAAETRATEKW